MHNLTTSLTRQECDTLKRVVIEALQYHEWAYGYDFVGNYRNNSY